MTSFESVWLKLGRAKQHIDDLEAAIIAFHRTDPYPLVAEDDPQTGNRTVKIGSNPAPIPSAVPLILGDAVHAIRSTLDHFAFAAAAKGQMPTASDQLVEAVCALQPHRGGNGEYLWLINRLDVIDKHRLLVTVGSAYQSFIFDIAAGVRGLADWTKHLPAVPLAVRPADRYPLKAGTPLFRAGPEWFEQQKDFKFTFDVAFGEPEIVVGEPIVPTLRRLLDEVDGLLKRLIPLV